MENNTACCICLCDKPNLPIKLVCGHIFCYLCIKSVKMSNVNATCPLCRTNIDKKIMENMEYMEEDSIIANYQWLY